MSTQPDALMDWTDYEAHAPGTVAALRALGKAVEESGLDKALAELLKVRVSQINGCAYCLQLHLNMARKVGVPQAKLDLLPTWREVRLYSERERAALAWAEALTDMNIAPVEDLLFDDLSAEFQAQEVANLTAAVANINAWNRIAGTLRFTPPASMD